MPKSPGEQQLDRIELFLNELQADMQIFQVVLQDSMATSISSFSGGKEILVQLQTDLRRILEAAPSTSADPQDDERMRRLTVARLELFFRPLNRRFGVPSGAVPGKTN